MIRLVVVDDHPVVIDGLAALFSTVDTIEVVASAQSGTAAVREVRAHRPDVVLMDLQMKDGDGVQATREIMAIAPETAVIALTMSEDASSIARAIGAGARGYVLKGAPQKEILRAVEAVAGGGAWYGPEAARQIVRQFADPVPSAASTPLPQLTEREAQVLDLLAAGHRNNRIAQRLGLSSKTVANHLSTIFAKLGVEDRTQAVIRARQAGLGEHRPEARSRSWPDALRVRGALGPGL
jgi:DNA-binding NarL/FixJ family response regulator